MKLTYVAANPATGKSKSASKTISVRPLAGGASVPGAPQNVRAITGSPIPAAGLSYGDVLPSVQIGFDPPADNGSGSPLTYKVEAVDQTTGAVITAVGDSSPITIPGLTYTEDWTFSVQDLNNIGWSKLTTIDLFHRWAYQISAGWGHTCAVMFFGNLECWGDNSSGQLGDGTQTLAHQPVQVLNTSATGTISGVVQVAAGFSHTCALLNDSTVECWGDGSHGALGNNSNSGSNTPVTVLNHDGTAPLTGVMQIATGSRFTCALINDGTVDCWGRNDFGQLGNYALTDSPTPTSVVKLKGLNLDGTLTGVTQITAGGYHACARINDGTAVCWGDSSLGQAGNGVKWIYPGAVQVVGVGGAGYLLGVAQIAAGGDVTCARVATGGSRCWGDNNHMSGSAPLIQLGDGAAIFAPWGQSTPLAVVDGSSKLLTGTTQVTVGGRHMCALLSSGGVDCWGMPEALGSANPGLSAGPVRNPTDTDNLSGADQVSAGGYHTCALMNDGRVLCWGDNTSGQLGFGSLSSGALPGAVQGL